MGKYKKTGDKLKYYECVQILNSLILQGFVPIAAEGSKDIYINGKREPIAKVADALYHSIPHQEKLRLMLYQKGIEPEFYVSNEVLSLEEEYEKYYKDNVLDHNEYNFLENLFEHFSS